MIGNALEDDCPNLVCTRISVYSCKHFDWFRIKYRICWRRLGKSSGKKATNNVVQYNTKLLIC